MNRVKDYHWVNCGGCGRFVSWINNKWEIEKY